MWGGCYPSHSIWRWRVVSGCCSSSKNALFSVYFILHQCHHAWWEKVPLSKVPEVCSYKCYNATLPKAHFSRNQEGGRCVTLGSSFSSLSHQWRCPQHPYIHTHMPLSRVSFLFLNATLSRNQGTGSVKNYINNQYEATTCPTPIWKCKALQTNATFHKFLFSVSFPQQSNNAILETNPPAGSDKTINLWATFSFFKAMCRWQIFLNQCGITNAVFSSKSGLFLFFNHANTIFQKFFFSVF